MPKILLLFAHPAMEKSRVHKKLIRKAKQISGVYVNDLYEQYPDLDIDIAREQQLLLQHDIIIWQHPFYWYSAPAMIKQWQDLVLEHGWAYGSTGKALAGKQIFNVISCGGSQAVYQPDGANRFTINQFLVPFNQTAYLCKMEYLPPFVIHGTHKLNDTDIDLYATQYEEILIGLTSGRLTANECQSGNYLNDVNPLSTNLQS
jgi:glutathione-regulated potassium-efflux system ancillary protein KefG